jgi:hypothetical protein
MEKRYKPGDTACERRQFIAPRFRLPRRDIAQVNLGHPACRARRRADGASATVCKAACLNTQQTVKNEQFAITCAGVLRDSFYGKASKHTGM